MGFLFRTAMLIAAFSVSIFVADARVWDEGNYRGLTLEMGASVNQYRDDALIIGPQPDKYPWVFGCLLTPRIGFSFNDNYALGALFRYDTNHVSKHYGFGAYIDRTVKHFDNINLRIFVEAQWSYNHNDHDYIADYRNFTEIGLVPGVAFRIPSTPVDLKLRYLFLGYNDDLPVFKQSACLGRGEIILDAGLRRLEIAAAITF